MDYEKLFQEAEVEEQKNFKPVPDGKYNVVVSSVEYTTIKETDIPLLKWKLKILDGDYEGRYVWCFNSLRDETTAKHFKFNLHLVGVKIDSLKELPQKVENIMGYKVNITLINHEDTSTVYFNYKLDETPF